MPESSALERMEALSKIHGRIYELQAKFTDFEAAVVAALAAGVTEEEVLGSLAARFQDMGLYEAFARSVTLLNMDVVCIELTDSRCA